MIKMRIMRRLLSIIVFVLTVSISSFAQIQTSIYGLTLGKTTKKAAISIMQRKGYNMEYNRGPYVCYKPISFGGVTWSGVEISFMENKVSSITFQIIMGDVSKLTSFYDNIRTKLDKYSRYKTGSESGDFWHGRSEDYSDGVVSIHLRQTYASSDLYLTYTYIKEDSSQVGAGEL